MTSGAELLRAICPTPKAGFPLVTPCMLCSSRAINAVDADAFFNCDTEIGSEEPQASVPTRRAG